MSGNDKNVCMAEAKLARDGAGFGKAERPFEDALPLWRQGLVTDE
jgi:hypothetical protein